MKFLFISLILTGLVAVLVALYLRWTAQALAGFRCNYFVCYGVALLGCLVNLFGPFIYVILMEPYRKLPVRGESILLQLAGIFFCIWLYRFWLRSPERKMLSWWQATCIAGAQYAIFALLSYGIFTTAPSQPTTHHQESPHHRDLRPRF